MCGQCEFCVEWCILGMSTFVCPFMYDSLTTCVIVLCICV